jgi:hypothetical protein
VYALPVVLVLLYVYGGSIAATVEGGAAPQLAALMSGPAHEVRPRIDYATGMPMSAPDMPPPVAPLAPMPAVNSAETTVSARLAQIENSLQRS